MYREEVGAAPGSVSQVREATASLMRLAKGKEISIFIVGHVTKEGTVAGPRMLEHMVDTVLYFAFATMLWFPLIAIQAASTRFFMVTVFIANFAIHSAWSKHTYIYFFF